MGDINFNSHTMIIDNRKGIDVSGVKEVISFDDETILLDTIMGKITVKGEDLKISSFNNETGDLKAEGFIHGVVYISDDEQKGGFISRIFK